MENLTDKYNVSRETYEKLKIYVDLLQAWQEKFNLVSKNSLPDVWTRHIEDSLQLFRLLPPSAERLYDLGSGAGFPAMVLALQAQAIYPDLKFTLIESITKKTLYLNEVKRVLSLENVTVLNDRSENVRLPSADVITARAVTALDKLLDLSFPFCQAKTLMIFPKGRTYAEEIAQARQKWKFNVRTEENLAGSDGIVLCLSDLRRK